MHRALKLLVVAGFCLPWTAYAQSHPPLEYGYPEQTARVFTTAQLQPDGNVPGFLTELLDRAGIPWHSTSYPAARLMRNLQSGETQLGLLVRNSLLNECCLYSKTSFWRDDLRVYWQGDKPAIVNRDDLKGKSVVGLAGFSYGGVVDFLKNPANGIDYSTAESHDSAFAMLKAGRADYLLDYSEPAEKEALIRTPLPNLHHATIDVLNVYLVLNKNYPQAQATMDMLERLHAELRVARNKSVVAKP